MQFWPMTAARNTVIALAAITLYSGIDSGSGAAQAAEIAVSRLVTEAKSPSHGTRLILLGTGGGPILRHVRSQPSSAIEVGGRLYLIDTGDGVVRQLVAAGFSPADIDKIFYTHLHFDHTIGLAPLLGFNWMTQKAKHYDIYGPAGTQEFVSKAVAYVDFPVSIYAAEMPPVPSVAELLQTHEVDVSEQHQVIYQDKNLRVTAVENTHYETIPTAKLIDHTRSYSLRFDTTDRSLVFTGDTGYSDSVVKLAKGADVMVSEVLDMNQTEEYIRRQYGPLKDLTPMLAHIHREHMSPEDVGWVASRAGVGMVVLSHVAMAYDSETDFRHYTDGVRKNFKGPVIIGIDLMNL